MSEEPSQIDPEQEQYAYRITKRLFRYTLVGTVLFAATIIGFWIFFN